MWTESNSTRIQITSEQSHMPVNKSIHRKNLLLQDEYFLH